MSIESEINRIKQNIANAYTYCSEKGGTMPQTQDSANLAATVSSVPSGVDIYDYIEEEPISDSSGLAPRHLLKKLPSITISQSITTLSSTFDACINLEEIEGITNNSLSTTTSYMFRDCKELKSIPLFNMSYVAGTQYMFQRCVKLTSVPNFNFSNVANLRETFSGCTSLTTIPALTLTRATNLRDTFLNCPNLSNDTLNNIMAMCISATSYASTKTLAYIGLTSTQATTCTGLSNYSSFTAAGWTTGY